MLSIYGSRYMQRRDEPMGEGESFCFALSLPIITLVTIPYLVVTETYNKYRTASLIRQYNAMFDTLRRSELLASCEVRCRDYYFYWRKNNTWHVIHVRPPYTDNNRKDIISILCELHNESPYANIVVNHVDHPSHITPEMITKMENAALLEHDLAKSRIHVIHKVYSEIWSKELRPRVLVSDKYDVVQSHDQKT
jgi:hypothetical protein